MRSWIPIPLMSKKILFLHVQPDRPFLAYLSFFRVRRNCPPTSLQVQTFFVLCKKNFLILRLIILIVLIPLWVLIGVMKFVVKYVWIKWDWTHNQSTVVNKQKKSWYLATDLEFWIFWLEYCCEELSRWQREKFSSGRIDH